MLSYISVKTPSGEAVGCLKIRNNSARLSLKHTLPGNCFLFTASGLLPIQAESDLPVSEPVQAVAALYGNKLAYWGAAQGCRLTPTVILFQLSQKSKPKSPPVQALPKPKPAPKTEPLPKTELKPEGKSFPVSAPASVPDPALTATLNPVPAPTFEPPAALYPPVPVLPMKSLASAPPDVPYPPFSALPPYPTEAITPSPLAPLPEIPMTKTLREEAPAADIPIDATVSHTADFSELLSHATRVYSRIDRPPLADAVREDPTPLPQHPLSAPPPNPPWAERLAEEIPLAEMANPSPAPLPQQPFSSPAQTAHEAEKLSAVEKSEWMRDVHSLLRRPPEQKEFSEQRELPEQKEAQSQEKERRIHIDNPFPQAFPGALWHSVTGEGVLSHLSGQWQRGGESIRLIAVAGPYSPHPPRHLFGFTRYIRSKRDGYWIKMVDEKIAAPR